MVHGSLAENILYLTEIFYSQLQEIEHSEQKTHFKIIFLSDSILEYAPPHPKINL